jgi:predicted nucleic acid-binding protein
MALPYIDSNILVRYIARDHPAHAARARALLERLEDGRLTATTCEAVLLEVVQVLSSKALYNLPRADIAAFLTRFLDLKGLKLPHKRATAQALARYGASNLDFTDCLIVEHMAAEGSATVFSFDTDFDKIPAVSRREA